MLFPPTVLDTGYTATLLACFVRPPLHKATNFLLAAHRSWGYDRCASLLLLLEKGGALGGRAASTTSTGSGKSAVIYCNTILL